MSPVADLIGDLWHATRLIARHPAGFLAAAILAGTAGQAAPSDGPLSWPDVVIALAATVLVILSGLRAVTVRVDRPMPPRSVGGPVAMALICLFLAAAFLSGGLLGGEILYSVLADAWGDSTADGGAASQWMVRHVRDLVVVLIAGFVLSRTIYRLFFALRFPLPFRQLWSIDQTYFLPIAGRALFSIWVFQLAGLGLHALLSGPDAATGTTSGTVLACVADSVWWLFVLVLPVAAMLSLAQRTGRLLAATDHATGPEPAGGDGSI